MQDVADVPAHLLEQAIRQHVLKSPYLPKASDLIAIAKSLLPARPVTHSTLSLAARYNNRMAEDPQARKDIQWKQDEAGNLYLETIEEHAPRRQAREEYCSADEAARILREFGFRSSTGAQA